MLRLKKRNHLVSEWREINRGAWVSIKPKYKRQAKKALRKRVRLQLKKETKDET